MRVLYLIFSHHRQNQLARLAHAIRQLSPNCILAIHHDPQNTTLDSRLFLGLGDLHVIPDAVRGEWGDFSLVEQYLHSFEWCMENLSFDWVVTVTGLSYPLIQLSTFEEMLEHTDADAFVYHFDAFDPTHWPEGTGARRYLYAYFKLPRNPYYYKVPASIRGLLTRTRNYLNNAQSFFKIIQMPRKAPMRLGLRRAAFPFDASFKIHGGRQMLNVRRIALDHIFGFLRENPGYINYSRRTLIPDEAFFTSILANDPGLRVSNNVLRYIKWPQNQSHASSVDVITKEEAKDALKSGQPFGLKFDIQIEPEALSIVDEALGLKYYRHTSTES